MIYNDTKYTNKWYNIDWYKMNVYKKEVITTNKNKVRSFREVRGFVQYVVTLTYIYPYIQGH